MSEESDPSPAPAVPPRPVPPPTPIERFRDLFWSIDRRQVLTVAGALVGVVALVWWALRPAPTPVAPVELSLPTAAPLATVQPTAPVTSAEVHVAGAVVRPGLVTVGSGSRVADAVAAAGGPASDADVDRVNLAAPIADGDRIWIPHVGEIDVPSVVSGPGTSSGAAGPIDLNSATIEELETLPGVGPATATAIVAERDRIGRFATVDDLLDVPGIGPAKLEQLRDGVRVAG